MKSRLPRTAHYAERIALADARPGHGAPAGSFVNPIRINRTERTIGDYPSRRMGKYLPFHSSHQLLLFELFDVLPPVSKYWSEPQSFTFLFDEKWHRYTVDVVAEGIAETPLMIEVKPKEKLPKENDLALWAAVADAIAAKGFGFAFASDDTLLTPMLRENLTFLSRFRHYRFESGELENLNQRLAGGPLPLEELRTGLVETACGARLIEAAIFHRHIFVDLWEPLVGHTPVSLTPPAIATITQRFRGIECAY